MSRPAFHFLLGVAGPSRWSVPARQFHTGFCNTAHRADLATRPPSVFLPLSRDTHLSRISVRLASTKAEGHAQSSAIPSPLQSVPRSTPSDIRQHRDPRPPGIGDRKGGSRTQSMTGFRASTKGWPWVPMKSRVQGLEAEQRVIFNRPYENVTFGPGIWILPILWVFTTMFTGMYIAWVYVNVYHPESTEREDPGMLGRFSFSMTAYLGVPGVIALTASMMLMTSKQWATITRLSQIQVRPAPGQQGQTKQFIRLVHALHPLGLGMTPRYRDVPLEWIQVRSLSNLRVKLIIQPPGKSSQNYIIPLNETQYTKETAEDVVMSLQRLVMTFGEIRPETREEMQAELNNSIITRTFDKLFGYKSPEAPAGK